MRLYIYKASVAYQVNDCSSFCFLARCFPRHSALYNNSDCSYRVIYDKLEREQNK